MADKKMTKAQAGRLGGLQAAHNLGAEGLARRGRKGGEATVAAHGTAHMTRLAMRKNGYNVKVSA